MQGLTIRRRAWLAGAAGLVATGASARLADTHPLAGKAVTLSILGPADRRASALVREMAPAFVAFAKGRYGYDVTVQGDEAPSGELYQRAAAALAAKVAEINLVIADSQFLGALASEKLILPINPLIEANPELDVEWYAPTVREAYQLFPDGSNNRWGMPQAADVLVLFVRRDLLTAAGESEAFKAKYGMELPQGWDDFEKLAWDDYVKVLEFFNRPADGYHGFASDRSSGLAVSFMFGRGGQLWDAKSGQVEGVLNTEGNARALAEYASLARYQPDDADVAALFAQGKVFSALQWASAGPSMIPDAMREQVVVVPPPGFRGADGAVARSYVIGGQIWALNDHNDEAQTLVAVDFLKWWYLPETALAFARQGGLPCDRATLSRDDFDALQPWSAAYKYMLKRSGDLWHDPKFAELLAAQQAGFGLFASGKLDAKLTLDLVACRQQMILFAEGSAERRPGDACRALQH